LPIEVVRIRNTGERSEIEFSSYFNQTSGVPVGQRLDERGIDEGEKRDTGGNTKSEDKYSGDGETGTLAQLTNGEKKILQNRFERNFGFHRLLRTPRFPANHP